VTQTATETAADSTWQGFSLSERDRRWATVRRYAADAGLDCVLVPPGDPFNARYLADAADSAFVLPTDGSTPVGVNDRGRANAWVSEVRGTGNRTYGPALAQVLIDAGLEHGRIGITGFEGGMLAYVRAPEGVALYGPLTELQRRLPDATFVDATDIVGRARYVKSDEEIECLRRATAIAEAAIEEMIEHARPGADAAVVYGRATGRLLELGSEHYRHGLAFNLRDPGEPSYTRYTDPPVRRRLLPGTYITNEVSAVWSGLVAQEDQPIYLGRIPDEWRPAIDLQREVFDAGLKVMKPGATFGELIDFTNGFGAQRGMSTRITMHGRGNSDDGPLLTTRDVGSGIRELVIEKGTAWCWKPYGVTADGGFTFQWGGDVVVTEHGGEPLMKRPHGLVSVT
jgi:Xaa-Pro aminopeptidase